jgi:hypothetical protein
MPPDDPPVAVPLPPQRSTAWQPFDSGLERRVFWTPGYDCRIACQHETKGEHGQHGDELQLVVRVPDFAISLEMMTKARGGAYTRGAFDETGPVYPYGVTDHSPCPTNEEDVRDGRLGVECGLISSGRCYPYMPISSVAATLWTRADTIRLGDHLVDSNVEEAVLELQTGVWWRLAQALHDARARLLAINAALPAQCLACHGTGLVPK